MKTLNNYKHIRRKPNVWGFTYENLLIFFVIGFLCALIFMFGFSFVKFITFIVLMAINYVVCMYLLSGNVFNDLLSEKFPEELNDLTKKNG